MLRLRAIEKQINVTNQLDSQNIKQKINNLTCEEILEREFPSTKKLDALTIRIQDHLDKTENLTTRINQTRPEPIQIHFVPELSNLSLHNSGKVMQQAFDKIINHPVKAIEKVGQEAIDFVEKELGNPFKIIIIIVIALVTVMTVSIVIKKLRRVGRKQDNNHELKMVKKLVSS